MRPYSGPEPAQRWPPQRAHPPAIHRRMRRHEPIEEWEVESDDDDEYYSDQDDDLSDSGESAFSDDNYFSEFNRVPRRRIRQRRESFVRRRPENMRGRYRRQGYGDGVLRHGPTRYGTRNLYGRGGGIDRVSGRYQRDRYRTGEFGGSAYNSGSPYTFADDI